MFLHLLIRKRLLSSVQVSTWGITFVCFQTCFGQESSPHNFYIPFKCSTMPKCFHPQVYASLPSWRNTHICFTASLPLYIDRLMTCFLYRMFPKCYWTKFTSKWDVIDQTSDRPLFLAKSHFPVRNYNNISLNLIKYTYTKSVFLYHLLNNRVVLEVKDP